MHASLLRTPNGLMPADKATEEYLAKVKPGEVIHGDIKRYRNPKFHRKLFALLNLGFEYWTPGIVSSKYGVPEKNFDRFREDCIILAGYYHTTIRLDGTVRVEADSISFSNMDEDTFDGLYQNILTVILQKVLPNMERAEVECLVDKFLMFA